LKGDESKPVCNRCNLARFTCSYQDPVFGPPLTATDAPHSLSLRFPLSTVLFATNQEYRHFRMLCETNLVRLLGPFETKLWLKVDSQVGASNAGVLHAIAALDALQTNNIQEDPKQNPYAKLLHLSNSY
jgi:hypothetical protein